MPQRFARFLAGAALLFFACVPTLRIDLPEGRDDLEAMVLVIQPDAGEPIVVKINLDSPALPAFTLNRNEGYGLTALGYACPMSTFDETTGVHTGSLFIEAPARIYSSRIRADDGSTEGWQETWDAAKSLEPPPQPPGTLVYFDSACPEITVHEPIDLGPSASSVGGFIVQWDDESALVIRSEGENKKTPLRVFADGRAPESLVFRDSGAIVDRDWLTGVRAGEDLYLFDVLLRTYRVQTANRETTLLTEILPDTFSRSAGAAGWWNAAGSVDTLFVVSDAGIVATFPMPSGPRSVTSFELPPNASRRTISVAALGADEAIAAVPGAQAGTSLHLAEGKVELGTWHPMSGDVAAISTAATLSELAAVPERAVLVAVNEGDSDSIWLGSPGERSLRLWYQAKTEQTTGTPAAMHEASGRIVFVRDGGEADELLEVVGASMRVCMHQSVVDEIRDFVLVDEGIILLASTSSGAVALPVRRTFLRSCHR